MNGKIQEINKDEQYVKLHSHPKPLHYDKILIAWGSEKMKFDKNYENVFYLSDRFAHAKIHNEMIKSKRILIYGETLEAFQVASSTREYLDSLGYKNTQIVVLSTTRTQAERNFKKEVYGSILKKLREQRISVVSDVKLTKMSGDYRLEQINWMDNKFLKSRPTIEERVVEHAYKPDMVIVENGVGAPKQDLKNLLNDEATDSNLTNLMMSNDNVPTANVRFSLQPNDIQSTFLACGSATTHPSFF